MGSMNRRNFLYSLGALAGSLGCPIPIPVYGNPRLRIVQNFSPVARSITKADMEAYFKTLYEPLAFPKVIYPTKDTRVEWLNAEDIEKALGPMRR